MRLRSYFRSIEEIVINAKFLASHTLSFEERYPFLGLIRGSLTFIDGSQLYITEFIEAGSYIKIIKYRYHYMRGNNIIFRYDNAHDRRAEELPTFPHHKHTKDGRFLPSDPPALEDVLQEVEEHIQLR